MLHLKLFLEIPSEDALITAGKALLDSTTSWKAGKAYHNKTVQTYTTNSTSAGGSPWHCRLSEHSQDDFTFDEMWDHLGKDKAKNEAQCVYARYKTRSFLTSSDTQVCA